MQLKTDVLTYTLEGWEDVDNYGKLMVPTYAHASRVAEVACVSEIDRLRFVISELLKERHVLQRYAIEHAQKCGAPV